MEALQLQKSAQSSIPQYSFEQESEVSGTQDEDEKMLLTQALLLSLGTNARLHSQVVTDRNNWILKNVTIPILMLIPPSHSKFAVYMEIIGEGLEKFVAPLSFPIILKIVCTNAAYFDVS
ncbi:hypothetical protein G9A89_004655 [Geosiphon pyriformis]|nr:hypothetical protein G9A89_004655 [Geosiphon pyriformis]